MAVYGDITLPRTDSPQALIVRDFGQEEPRGPQRRIRKWAETGSRLLRAVTGTPSPTSGRWSAGLAMIAEAYGESARPVSRGVLRGGP
jgi:hypothetical protein